MSILKNIRQQKNKKKNTFRKPFTFEDTEESTTTKAEEARENNPKLQKARKNKKGRPKVQKENLKNAHIGAVLTQIELKKLNKLVVKSRLSKSEYIRRLILQAIEKNIYHL